ncbi:hypothetical protein ACMA5I_13800 [Paracoccaceae bacterium GXU_MW_L88]
MNISTLAFVLVAVYAALIGGVWFFGLIIGIGSVSPLALILILIVLFPIAYIIGKVIAERLTNEEDRKYDDIEK